MLKKILALLQFDSLTSALKSFIGFLVLFVTLEFILLRVLMRMGPVLPKTEIVSIVFQVVILTGEIAFNIAFLLSAFTLVLIAVILARSGSFFVGLSFLIFSVLLSGLLFFVALVPIVSLVYSLLSFSVFVSATLIVKQKNVVKLLFLTLVSLAYFCSYYYNVASSVAGMGVGASLPIASEVFSAGELLAISVVFLAFFVFKPKRNLTAAFIASAIVIMFVTASGSVWLPLLSTWTLYFTLHLPMFIYAIALWLYTYMIVDMLGEERKRLWAYGFLLIAFGGRMLQLTYLNQLAILGFLLLSVPFISKRNTSPH